MTETHVQRRLFTQAVLTRAATAGKPVGDAEAPRGGVAGWQGPPNENGSNFVPYSVITPMNAAAGSGPLADPQADVILPYGVTSYGVSRNQCEWMADAVRAAIRGLRGNTVTMWSGAPEQYDRLVQQVLVTQIGQVQRVTDTDPPYFGQSDIVSIWTSR